MTGKIAIVRYGGNFRGLKVKAAQEAGAVGEQQHLVCPLLQIRAKLACNQPGCIIYSDPAEDGEGESSLSVPKQFGSL